MVTSSEKHRFESQEMNLYRLLHCMKNSDEDVVDEWAIEQETNDTNIGIDDNNNWSIPHRRSYQKEQIQLAIKMLTHLQDYVHQLLLNDDGQDDNSQDNEWNNDTFNESILDDIQRRLEFMTNEVKSTCEMVSNHEIDLSDGRSHYMGDECKNDFYDELFGEESDSDTAAQDSLNSGVDDLPVDDDTDLHGLKEDVPDEYLEQQERIANLAATNKGKEKEEDEEERLQNEISAMASQLKQSTMHINSTLSSQNVHLDTMETLAQNNLDSTKNVTENVTDHNKQYGWRKTTSRWLVFFLVLVTFIICFWIVRIIPKRSDACVFNCSRRQYKYGQYDQNDQNDGKNYDTRGQGHTDHTSHESSSSRTVDPKYSYCKDAQNGEGSFERHASCSRPQNLNVHDRTMERVNNQIDGTDDAENFAWESKAKRYQSNLEKAKLENDDIASNRVKDGWDENLSMVDEDEIENDNSHDSDNQEFTEDDYYFSDEDYEDDDDDDYYYDNEDGDDFDDDDDYYDAEDGDRVKDGWDENLSMVDEDEIENDHSHDSDNQDFTEDDEDDDDDYYYYSEDDDFDDDDDDYYDTEDGEDGNIHHTSQY